MYVIYIWCTLCFVVSQCCIENRYIFILINSRGTHFNRGIEVPFSLTILKFTVFINILLSAVLGCNLSIGFFCSSLPLLNWSIVFYQVTTCKYSCLFKQKLCWYSVHNNKYCSATMFQHCHQTVIRDTKAIFKASWPYVNMFP